MGLMDALRRAEQKGKDLARRSTNSAREGLDDAQRRVRQKMRMYPPSANRTAEPDAKAREMEDAQRKAIVSVHGEDVAEDELGRRDRKVA